MTTSQPLSLTSLVCNEDVQLTPAQIGYMNGRAKADAHEVVLGLFVELAAGQGMTQAFLARRLGKKPEQISRWLEAPGNWTLDTLSNLLAAMGHEPTFSARPLAGLRQTNDSHTLASAPLNDMSKVDLGNSLLSDIKLSDGIRRDAPFTTPVFSSPFP